MKRAKDNLNDFISKQKAFFELNISPKVKFNWESDSWISNVRNEGVFSASSISSLCFTTPMVRKGIYFKGEAPLPKAIKINQEFQEFMKAYVVFKIHLKNSKISMSALNRDVLILKRIYLRMVINGHLSPKIMNIDNEIVNQMMTTFSSSIRKIANSSDSHTAMRTVARDLSHIGVTLNPLTFDVTIKRASSKNTDSVKKAKTKAFHQADVIDDLDDDENEKLITIQTFLNIVAVRSMVQTDSEKIMLNMLMLLMITGFRYRELERLRFDSLKKMEIEDKAIEQILKTKGLKAYYLGIVYIGEKSAGTRTHWVEPLAIELVETIYRDTLNLTSPLREHVSSCRSEGFSSLLPQELKLKDEILLDDVVNYIVESLSTTALARGRSMQRHFSKNALARFNITPTRICKLSGRRKAFYYLSTDIERYLKLRASSSANVNDSNFTYNFVDSSNGESIKLNIEELLFIVPDGSTALAKTMVVKPIPCSVSISNMAMFLGRSNGLSLFQKYSLMDKSGQYSHLTTHMPRHTINTFLAIAGISDHIQAAMMGRVDISQNENYQHLAIEQRALSSAIVPMNTQFEELEMYIDNSSIESPLSNPLDIIKESANISINPLLDLKNAIAQNTHTFTTKEDKSSFIADVFESSTLDIMAGLGNAYEMEKSSIAKKQLIERHSDLHPLDFGSCMRKLESWACPYALKCQDGTPCPYFTIIGRADERQKLIQKVFNINNHIENVMQCLESGELSQSEAEEIHTELLSKKKHLEHIKICSAQIEMTKHKVNLVALNKHRKAVTLATIFASEHMKIEAKS
ncbi:hypothetical protein [Shewanella nanhaiensis]|uniref:Tyr recombinase domain-containing protein n=1 Tax=Shewanella nanhaiensis TaxID=2864872 RepID=A0ABS7E762_9GAMM|nr:hypothetical protein [Shewanella nanhaiensis]MBW8185511.1 hypothetical protein [Shewanella nanhaiensis]